MKIPRRIEPVLRQQAREYPVLAVTGPRQSGKTTLVRTVFSEKPYVSLEDLDERAFAREDPRGFLDRYPDGAILDEVQNSPDLFSYLQTRVDQEDRMGLFVLTGSQQFGLLSGVSQSLAGRVALLTLLPLSLSEILGANLDPGPIGPFLHRRSLSPGPFPGSRSLLLVRELCPDLYRTGCPPADQYPRPVLLLPVRQDMRWPYRTTGQSLIPRQRLRSVPQHDTRLAFRP